MVPFLIGNDLPKHVLFQDLAYCAKKCLSSEACNTACIAKNVGLTNTCSKCFAEDISGDA